jgi:PAS domain S-box-containing protein
MKIYDRDFLYGQKLDTIKQEVANSGLASISDEELLELFSKYAQQLYSILNKGTTKTSSTDLISELCDTFYTSFREPLFIVDNFLNICYKNIPDIKLFEDFKNIMFFKDILNDEEFNRLQLKVSEREHCQISVNSGILNLNFNLVIIPFEPQNNDNAYTLLIFKESLSAQKNSFEFIIPDIFKRLLDTINGFYFVADNLLNFILVSESIREKLGYTTKELIGNPIAKIIPKKDNPFLFEKLADEFQIWEKTGLLKPSVNEITIVDNKGRLNYYEIAWSKYAHDSIKCPFLLCTCTDITNRSQKTIQLEIDKNKAEQNDQLKSEFLSNMSHEIRTPLNGILGFSAMLDREGIDSEKRDKYMKIIRSSSRHLLTLINDIIDFSKIEAGQLKMVFSKSDAKQLIDELYLTYLQEISRLSKDSVALIKFTGNSHKKVFINTDEIRIQQVLINLLNNALKFTDTGKIEFGYTISEKEDSIRFFVRDTGVGIPLAQQELIFKRFLQTREGEKQKYNGTGLGLAISKGIIELMGSDLKVESKINTGSEFYFKLPLDNYQTS